jgi:hypothetical protein
LAISWQIRDRRTPGNPVVTVTEAQWRAFLSRYIEDIDTFERNLTADTNWVAMPEFDLWMTNGAFSPPIPFTGVATAGVKPTHRQNNNAKTGRSIE